MSAPDLLVLLDAADRRAERESYQLWPLLEAAAARGLRYALARGPAQALAADALFPHVDRTVTPPDVVALFARYPRVLNRGVVDISKRRVSQLLVARDDAWDGPVIVKTDANAGGAPERRLAAKSALARLRAAGNAWLPGWARSLKARLRAPAALDLGRAETLAPDRYPIFASLAELPAAVFANPHLVVERFLPEREGDLYAVRSWVFCGERSHSLRRLAAAPVVRAQAVLRRDPCEVPPEIAARRRQLRFDYGKFDFVLAAEGALLLDTNRTPKLPTAAPSAARQARAENLAEGLLGWLAEGHGA